jgi:hypothetical protein
MKASAPAAKRRRNIEFSIPESLVGLGRHLAKATYFRRAAGHKHCDPSRANDGRRPAPIRGPGYLLEGRAEAKNAGSLYLAEVLPSPGQDFAFMIARAASKLKDWTPKMVAFRIWLLANIDNL